MKILGISCYYHDSAVSLVIDGKIIAAAQEERFTRIRHDSAFPTQSIIWCLKFANLNLEDIDEIVFYEDPNLKFKRLLSTYLDYFPKSIPLMFRTFIPWVFRKRFWKSQLIKEFYKNFGLKLKKDQISNTEHHLSHAASAFYPSNFEDAAILVMDGVGEFASTSIWKGDGNKIYFIEKINFPNSLGLLYSALTYYTGFKVNSGEYKVMGLAPYGNPIYVDLIKNNLIKVEEDGIYQLDMSYFSFTYSDYMTNDKFHDLFGGDPRSPESRITQKEMDIARSLQDVIEEVVLNLSKRALKRCSSKNLCLAGGVALNCVANGKILKQITDKLWIQPAAGDAGGALGAALYYHFNEQDNPRNIIKDQFDMMQGSYLGPSFTNEVVEEELVKLNAIYYRHKFSDLTSIISNKLIEGSVVGWFQGRMEFGPRALGNRSILGDARNTEMQKIMNLKIKYRESFRPFAPAVLEEKVSDYFDINTISPYMLLVSQVKDEIKLNVENFNLFGIDQLNLVRSKLPSVTHVDYSARIQTVSKNTNARFYDLIKDFYDKTGSAVLINTSFNVRGEPIVCSVEDAFLCFMRTEMDVLVINDFILIKNEQHDYDDDKKWMKQFELD